MTGDFIGSGRSHCRHWNEQVGFRDSPACEAALTSNAVSRPISVEGVGDKDAGAEYYKKPC
jgi:hypothetical protein